MCFHIWNMQKYKYFWLVVSDLTLLFNFPQYVQIWKLVLEIILQKKMLEIIKNDWVPSEFYCFDTQMSFYRKVKCIITYTYHKCLLIIFYSLKLRIRWALHHTNEATVHLQYILSIQAKAPKGTN